MEVLATGHPNVPLTWSWNWWPLTGVLLFFTLTRFVVLAPLRMWLLLPALVAGELFSFGVHRLGVIPTAAVAFLLAVFGSVVRQRGAAA